MDQHRIDALAKTLATGPKTRRRLLATAAGAVLAAVGLRRSTVDAQALPGRPWDWSGVVCGGIAGLECPSGYSCEIDWDDPECEADCMGWCRRLDDMPQPTDPCAAILCIEGTTCCSNCGGICVPHDVPCSDDLCDGTPCGPNWCSPGQTCCNESCGYCTWPGEACTEEYCGGEPCGPNWCGAGEYCCNDSCGHCAPIGGSCTMELCGEPPAQDPPMGEVCGPTVCPAGEVCCNSSCGICTPPGGFCIQIACA